MPASAVVTINGGLNVRALSARAEFLTPDGGALYNGLFIRAQKVRLQLGAQYSYALVEIPLLKLNERAPAVAGSPSSDTEFITAGTPCAVYVTDGEGNESTIFAGFVTENRPEFGPRTDTAIIEVGDGRYLIEGFPMIGSWWYDYSTGAQFRCGWNAVCNPDGEPNCIWATIAGVLVPVFCHPRYNLDTTEVPPDPDSKNQSKACHWTNKNILKLLRFHALNTAPLMGQYFPELPVFPDRIDWPDNMEVIIDALYPESANRKVPEMPLSGHNIYLGKLLNDVLESTGGLKLYMDVSNGNNTVKYAQSKFTDTLGNGISISRLEPGGSPNTRTIQAGRLGWSAKKLFTKFAVAGNLTTVERRLDTSNSDLFDICWTSDDEDRWRAAYSEYLGLFPSDPKKYENALRYAAGQYPHVFSAYRMWPAFKFMAGTLEEDLPQNIMGRPVYPELMSTFLPGDPNSAATKQKVRRPVLFEYKNAAGTWVPASFMNGLQLDVDGTIWINTLRDAQVTGVPGEWSGFGTQTFYFSAKPDEDSAPAVARKIRATFAIPCDHRLTTSAKLTTDPADISLTIKNDDNASISTLLSRTYYGQNNIYRRDWRIGANDDSQNPSFPIPKACGGNPVPETDVVQDDTNLLKEHVLGKASLLGRLDRCGTFKCPVVQLTWQPGMLIKDMNGYPVRAAVNAVQHEFGPMKEETHLETE